MYRVFAGFRAVDHTIELPKSLDSFHPNETSVPSISVSDASSGLIETTGTVSDRRPASPDTRRRVVNASTHG